MLHAGTIENCWVDVDFTGSRYCGALFGGTTWNTRYDSTVDSNKWLLTEKITGKAMIVRNNLTLGSVSANRYSAGILGDMANNEYAATDLDAFEGNVAWTESITVLANDAADYYDPVYANWKNKVYDPVSLGHQNNLYWEGMTLTGPDPSATQTDSRKTHAQLNIVAKTAEELSQQATYEAIGWDFENTWTWSEALGHPVLKAFAALTPYDPYAQTTPASVVTTFVNSPKTTRAFTWYTDTSVTKTIVQAVAAANYTDEGSFVGENAITAEGTNYKLETAANGTARHIHKAELTNLAPGTTYKYRVGDGENWSSVRSFTTERADADSFTFFNITDTQDETDGKSLYDRYVNTLDYATAAYPEAEFIFHSGDVIHWNSTADYDEVYRATSKYTTDLPSMITPGNHRGHY